MGNQHGTLKLAWLAGILDGEGSVIVIRSFRKGKARYSYRVSIANTSLLIIEECKAIFDDMGISYGLYSQDRGGDGLKRRPTYLLHVMRAEGIKALLVNLLPFVTEKKQRAQLLLNALNDWDSIDKEALWLLFRELNQRIPK